jgi:hypothetical protein
MTALQKAATNLLTQLQAAATTADDVYVSIIPFAKDVNVGTSNVNASWVRWTGGSPSNDAWDEVNGSCSLSGNSTRTSCQADSGCTNSNYTSRNSCTSHNGTWGAGVWTATSHSKWTGCVMDRDQNYDTTNDAPSSSRTSTLFPAEMYSDCPTQLMPLSNNWTALKNKINAMSPDGNTNTTIGLEWAWLSLMQGTPLNAPAEDSNYQYSKVIIFLTDGTNTQNRFSSSQSSIDARMTKACTNAKNAGITVYTILVLDGSATLLQGCASGSDKYFKITSSSQLVDVFSQIGTNLSRLRVAK